MSRQRKKPEPYSLGWILMSRVEGDQAQIVKVPLGPDGRAEKGPVEVVSTQTVSAPKRRRGVRALLGKSGAALFARAVERATADAGS